MHIFLWLIFSFNFSFAASELHLENPPAARNSDRYVTWQQDMPLKWENFRGKPEQWDVVHGAVTYAGINLKIENVHARSGEITFKATAIFDQYLSWVRPGKSDHRLLEHEQLHFDIAELYARKLEKKLNSLKPGMKDKQKIKQLQQYYSKAQLALQEKYDKETLHGIRQKQQQAWRHEIDRQLLISNRK